MEGQDPTGLEYGGRLEVGSGESRAVPAGAIREFLAWPILQNIKQEPDEGLQQRWEAQWKEFLKTVQAPQVSQLPSGEDEEEFQGCYPAVADAGHEAREKAATQKPIGRRKGQEASDNLDSSAQVKEETADESTIIQFCFQEAEEPQEVPGPLEEVAAIGSTKSEQVPLDTLKTEFSVEAEQEDDAATSLLVWKNEEVTFQPESPGQAGLGGGSPERADEGVLQAAEFEKAPGCQQREERRQRNQPKKRAKEPFICGKGDKEPLQSTFQYRIHSQKRKIKEGSLLQDTDLGSSDAEAGGKPSEYTCCKESSPESSHLAVHQRTHTGEKPYMCSDCGEGFAERAGLLQHAVTHTDDKPYTCVHCGKGFNSNSHLRAHTRIHTGEKPFACAHCGKHFGTGSHLKRHSRVHTGESPFQCSECGRRFTQKSSLIKHRRTHTGEKPYECLDCGKSYRDSSSLLRHIRAHMGKKPFQCSWCESRFIQRSDLLRHEGTHTGEKPYRCSVCGKAFGQKGSLLKHGGMHTGKNPYQCLDCGKSFGRKQSLIRHKRTHTGEKPYTCSACGKSFSTGAHLTIHERVHTGEKPYWCSECGKSFCRKPSLITHKRIHAAEKPSAGSAKLQ